jgi:hypothetical protein
MKEEPPELASADGRGRDTALGGGGVGEEEYDTPGGLLACKASVGRSGATWARKLLSLLPPSAMPSVSLEIETSVEASEALEEEIGTSALSSIFTLLSNEHG